MKKITIIFLVSLCLFIGLVLINTNKSFDDKVASYVNRNCDLPRDCILDISELTNFNWDTFYFFREGVVLDNNDLIQKFGQVNHGLTDRHIIFTLNDKIVYSERLKTGIEGRLANEIYFEIDKIEENIGYMFYSKEQSIFIVEKIPISDNPNIINKAFYFNLKSLNE